MTWDGVNRRQTHQADSLCDLLNHIRIDQQVQLQVLRDFREEFTSHITLDDRREVEQKVERKEIAAELMGLNEKTQLVKSKQDRMIGAYGAAIVVVQILLHFWK